MNHDKDQTKPGGREFDFSAYPENTLFHERRTGNDRRTTGPHIEPGPDLTEPSPQPATNERRKRKERRRRVDPTTFEKQYTVDELEFMNAMQDFKQRCCKTFPSYGEVLRVAVSLGYRKRFEETDSTLETIDPTFPIDPDGQRH